MGSPQILSSVGEAFEENPLEEPDLLIEVLEGCTPYGSAQNPGVLDYVS
jgi:hypothetical protein